jgi:enoyl-CoA hydratase/carnithine racemase
MTDPKKKLIVDKTNSGHWKVTLNNPPINMIDDSMYDDLYDLVGEMESAPDLRVITFESANPDFFIAHYSSAEPRSRFGVPRWIETAQRLAASTVLSIVVIRGRVRGGAANLRWGATDGSPAGRTLSLASPRLEPCHAKGGRYPRKFDRHSCRQVSRA